MKYITVGQASIDRSIRPDGSIIGINLGGPGVFAYTGIRLYDDNCQMILNVAEDFEPKYGDWIRRNMVNTDACYLCYDKTHAYDLIYSEDGSYYQADMSEKEKYDRAGEYGWTNVRPEQIERHTRNAEGLYIFIEPTYEQYWKQLADIKERHHLQIMYEIGIAKGGDYDRDHVLKVLDILKPQMASLNHNESCDFFGIEDREEIFRRIDSWNIPLFFYRAGEEGSYVLYDHKSYFCPSLTIEGRESLDPTGCGNSSTAACMWAWMNTHNPVMTGWLANIVGAYNVSYKGIISEFTKEMRDHAFDLAISRYNDYVKDNPEYVEAGYPAKGEEVLKDIR
ncbi:MAG: carbohydrate kinase family protein [Erysipelotrichaceae bacterium]|nr:carbohydrate kinase family protein [Erysipelotrichaceae bacterium]